MMNWPISSPWDSVLALLLGLWLGLHVFGFALGKLNAAGTSRFLPWTRMAASATLVICAAIWWLAGARGTDLQAFAGLIFAGMLFGFLGDLTLAGFLRLPQEIIFGILWFSIGHAFYISAGAQLVRRFALDNGGVLAACIMGMMMVSAVAWRLAVACPETKPVLNVGSLVYGLLLGATAGLALSIAIQQPRLVSLAVGLVLFMASDILLGNTLFRKNEFRLARDINWVLYIVGQLLIVFTTPAALRLL
jgi:hypothetical protein